MTQEISIRHAESRAEISACFETMREFRPKLVSAGELVETVTRQSKSGYRLLAAWRGDVAVGLAGYREQENMIHGRFVYVDDLVVARASRSKGLGARLLDAVSDECKRLGMPTLALDTAIGNSLGQRFYYRYGMLAGGLCFAIPVSS